MFVRGLATFIVVLLTAQDGQAESNINDLSLIYNPDILDSSIPKLGPESPDTFLDFKELAAKYGHPAEEYIVCTEDGYTLKVFRLPGKGYGLPILLFHGITDSSDTWIIRGNESLAIHLANAGYDVWLGNVRGNKYSREDHTSVTDLNETYWNFTFHELGIYDLPATIDLVLNKTGAPKLNSIGHSQGTMIHFVLLSSKPEYNEKVNLFIALAPVAYLHHSPPPAGTLFRIFPAIYDILKALKQYEVFSETSPSGLIVKTVCSTTLISYFICLLGVLYQYCGYDLTQIDPSFSLVVFQHTPTAVSTKNVLHLSQVVLRRSFARFDFGEKGNMVAYNSVEPPQYELEKVKSKVVLLTARNDFLSTQADVALLRQRLPNVVKFVVNPRHQMNHLDYIWGANMTTYLFPYIFNSLKAYG